MKGRKKMTYRYSDDDDRLLDGVTEDGAKDEIREDEEIVERDPLDETEYYDLPSAPEKRSRLWSVLSLGCAVLSILLCALYYVALPFAVAAIVFSVISRRTLGYFDGLSVGGLILGVVGIVFSSFALVVDLTGVLDALK